MWDKSTRPIFLSTSLWLSCLCSKNNCATVFTSHAAYATRENKTYKLCHPSVTTVIQTLDRLYTPQPIFFPTSPSSAVLARSKGFEERF